MTRAAISLAALMFTATAFAHGEKGPNGGAQADAGDYHVELVTKGTGVTVYLHDGKSEKPVDAKGHKGVGTFVVGGKAQRIELAPEASNKLTGTATAALPATPKGAVQITLPSGKTVQAKF
jgi:hypothetical protein